MKDPDGPSDGVYMAATDSLEECLGLTDTEKEMLHETRSEDIWDHVNKWLNYGEYVTLEIDTEADTCIVIKP